MRFKWEPYLTFATSVNIGPTSRYGAPDSHIDFYLQGHFKPNSDRAEELRKIEKEKQASLRKSGLP